MVHLHLNKNPVKKFEYYKEKPSIDIALINEKQPASF